MNVSKRPEALALLAFLTHSDMPPAALDAQTVRMPSPTWSHNLLEGKLASFPVQKINCTLNT
jgi:hypothetical protein